MPGVIYICPGIVQNLARFTSQMSEKMNSYKDFIALSPETLPARLGQLAAVKDRIGADAKAWKVREVGDGNLNLVFIVEGPKGTVVVKQALPYVRLVGDSWPLPLKRSFFEYHALSRQAERDPGMVPEIFHFDAGQAIIVMEFLSPHIILRRALIAGQELPKIAKDLGLFLARTLFRGSDLCLDTKLRKADLALFADNVALCDITESLVFSDPYYDAKLNRHTSPQLDGIVKELRADRDLKVAAQRLKHIFAATPETLLHGDFHTGSVMVTAEQTLVIDPEFAFYGPMAFDVGMLLANFWMSYFSQSGSGKFSAPNFPGSGIANAPAFSISVRCSRIRVTCWPQSRRSIWCCTESGWICWVLPVLKCTGAFWDWLTTRILKPSQTPTSAPAAKPRP
jgi:5-methylthioribose kinase